MLCILNRFNRYYHGGTISEEQEDTSLTVTVYGPCGIYPVTCLLERHMKVSHNYPYDYSALIIRISPSDTVMDMGHLISFSVKLYTRQ